MCAMESVIAVSPSDARLYKYIELENGLRAVLIQDREIAESKTKTPTTHALDHSADDSDGSGEGSDAGSSDDSDDSLDSEIQEGDDDANEKEDDPGTRKAPLVETKRAAAALSVGVGHFCDPRELPGLSHYLEHMLFMGSEKYPDENAYDAYLTQHNGSSNAFTEEESTTYHFECAPHAFEAALDRFAQFFIAPLMKPDALDREVLAVDSEFSGVLQNDSCRLAQVRAVSGPIPDDHPAAKFGWGNKKSLKDDPLKAGLAVRQYLLKHYQEHYRADRMNLVLISGDPLDVMESWVRSHFAGIPGSQGSRTRFDDLPLCGGGCNFGIVPSSRAQHKVSISFYLPSWLEKQYGKKAEDYVSHLVGHEGKGSLLALLKEREWATDLCAGLAEQTSAFWLFDITVTLTEQGLAAGPGCGLAAVQAVFGYLDMLRTSTPQKWIWDEMKAIAKIKWDYIDEEDPSDYVSQISGDLHVVPVKHALNWSYLHETFDADLIMQLLDDYMRPEHANIHLQTNEYEDGAAAARTLLDTGIITAVKTTREEWFDFDFLECTMDMSKAFSDKDMFEGAFHLPKKNPYIAENFALLADLGEGLTGKSARATPHPRRIGPSDAIHPTYHLLDGKFRLPKVASFFRFTRSGVRTSSPREVALLHLVIKLLEDVLCEEAYLADTAGLHYSIYMDGCSSIDFRIEGFNDKIDQLISLIFQSFSRLETLFKDDAFQRVKETVVRHYQNALMKPTKHASFLRLQTLKHHHEDPRDVKEEIESITADNVRCFVASIRTKGRLVTLISGNCAESAALAIAENAASLIGCTAWDCAPVESVLDMQPGRDGWILRREAVFNPQEGNSCIEYYLQIGHAADVKRRALLDLVDQVLYEPTYNTLRTKQQLGYIVSSGTRLTQGVLGLCITIQSKTHSGIAMEERIDKFLCEFLDVLRDMSDEEFSKNASALIEHKRAMVTTVSDQGERFWDALIHRDAAFDHREQDVAAIQATSKADVIAFFERHVAPGGVAVRKLVACVEKGTNSKGEKGERDPRLLDASSLARFQQEHKAYADESLLHI